MVTRKKPTPLVVAGLLLPGVLAVAFLVLSDRGSDDDKPNTGTPGAGACKADDLADPGADHVPIPSYEVNPPSGGDHSPVAARAGIYDSGDAPPDGQLVHALEHGYVILWHRTVDGKDLAVLRDVTRRHARDVLFVPRRKMPVPVAATAWHQRLLCSEPDPAALEQFVTAYANQGPEKIPH
ncbi:MAG: DUF3105 domain-containing protein [Acidimicrobiales bacterium]